MNKQIRIHGEISLRRFHLSSSYKSFYKLHQTLIEQKSSDKVHRSFYNSLLKEKKKYNKSDIKIQPTIRHLLFQLQREVEGNHEDIILNSKFVPLKRNMLLEIYVYHIILSVYYLYNDTKINKQHIEIITRAQIENMNELTVKHSMNDISFVGDIKSSCLQLLDPDHQDNLPQPLVEGVRRFLDISKGKYSINDLKKWIHSLTAGSVRQSCMLLEGLQGIPAFVLTDILLRSPMSKQDFHLQQDIWFEYFDEIMEAGIEKTSYLKLCFKNLVSYCIIYDIQFLPQLINRTIERLERPNKSYANVLLNRVFVEELIWHSSFCLLKSFAHQDASSVISCHEMLIKFLSRQNENVIEQLDLKAYMGIVITIGFKSTDVADRLFAVGEGRFHKTHADYSHKHIVSYNLAKIFLSKTPEELVKNFNSTSDSSSFSDSLWLVFLLKLKSFNLLTAMRSKKVLVEILKRKDTLVITKDLISVLIEPINGLDHFNEFVNLIAACDEKLFLSLKGLLLPRYLKILYKNYRSNGVKLQKFPWDDRNPSEFSVIEYARLLFRDCINNKSVSTISIMLQGEAIVNPTGVYELYKSELISKDVPPNDGCILALISASTKTANGQIIWGDLYAPQVAIAEFKRVVKDVYKSQILWRRYIRMLAKFDYVHELAGIIQFWEKLKFRPDQVTLLLLLSSLPKEYSQRYIDHFKLINGSENTVNKSENISDSSSWDWPTSTELSQFKLKNKIE
ncbi:hypothetical protein DFJ63DRAFT_332064 [Scheffersomyces coipomensis]|uniref:uncharacterized protein n=1 Tax=Scheffersomyces coipomensis TaxID=1788519 RepID=UPI00315D4363